MNPLIALEVKGPEIMTPFQLAAGAQALRTAETDEAVKRRAIEESYEPKKMTEKEKIETAMSRIAYVAQQLSSFVGKPYSPELDLQYRNTKKQIEKDIGQPMTSLPDKFDPETINTGYQQGMSVAHQLEQQYKLFSQNMDVNKFDYQRQHDADVLRQQEESQRMGRDVTMRGQDISSQNAGWAQTTGPDGLPVWTQHRTEGMPAYSQTGTRNQVISEDERKAAGWLAQADNAYKNILKVVERNPSAQAPGLGEAVVSSVAPRIKGAVQSTDRQQFDQAIMALSDPLLRAATGAGMNIDEAQRKIDELSPKFLDDDATRKQKLDAIPVFIESLKTRSGRALPQNYEIPTQPQSHDIPQGWTDADEAAYQKHIGGQ